MDKYLLKVAIKNAVKEALAENSRYTEESGKSAADKIREFTKVYSQEYERINKLTSTLAMTTKIINKYKEMTGTIHPGVNEAISFFAKKAAMGNKVF